jgi:hypothetical protein
MKELNELLSEIGRRFYGSQTQSNIWKIIMKY